MRSNVHAGAVTAVETEEDSTPFVFVKSASDKHPFLFKLSTPKLLKLGVVLCSFGWTLAVGHIGLFAFDQSIVFDGGWRILSGQVPFRDFVMAFGPMSLAVQALFFKVFGVNWTSMVLAAAFLSVAAALSVMRTMTLLFGKQRTWFVAWSGLLVGTSFQAMFGTLCIEQVGFLGCLLGIQAVCESVRGRARPRLGCLGLAGVLSVFAFLSKQNVGVLTLALLGTLTILAALPQMSNVLKSLASFAAGAGIAAGLFIAWLFRFSDPHLFVRHALEVPSEVGKHRVWVRLMLLLPASLQAARATQLCYGVALSAACVAMYLVWRDRGVRRIFMTTPSYRLALALTAGVPVVRSLFQAVTLNQSENLLFLSGLTLSFGVGLLGLLPVAPAKKRRWIPALACLVSAFLFFDVVYGSWNRTVHDVFPLKANALSKSLQVPRLKNILWISPTLTGHTGTPELNPQDINDLYLYLASRKQDFLILGDASYLYGVTGVVPPQPLLYFQENHFFSHSDIPAINEWMLRSLEKRNIKIIVREKSSFLDCYSSLPNVVQWITDNFQPGPTFGNFQILLR